MSGWKTPSIADIIEGAPVVAGGTFAHAPEPEGFDDDGGPAPAPPPDADLPLETLAHCASLEQNDTDNGQRLITHFGADLLHVREVGWHVWDERVWKREGGDETVQRLAQKTAKRIHLEADLLELQPWEVEAVEKAKPFRTKDKGALTDNEAEAIRVADGCKRALGKRRSGRRDFAVTSGNGGRVAAMVAQALPHKTVGPTQLDADEMRFACQNGTLRFERVEDDENVGDHAPNWKLKVTPEPHTRGHLITKLAPATYDPAAKCPTWDAFMERFQPDPEIRKFLQIYHGLSLTGQTGHQCFLYLYGTGANGKSTFVEALAHVFGPYSDLLNAESISGQGQRRGDQATPDFAELPGVRYLRISELPRGEGLKEALIKALTGGEPIKARHLNKGFFSFTPSFKAVMSGNDLPQIGGLDLGIWRRVKLVPWQVTIPDGERRPMAEVLAEFEAERSGILNWLIEGLDLYMREGLVTPQAVAKATSEYREEMDPIGAFTADCIIREKGSEVSARDLYNAFVDWCDANSVRPWKETMFGRAMPTKGFERKNGRVRYYLDVRLHPERPTRAEPRSPMNGGGYGA